MAKQMTKTNNSSGRILIYHMNVFKAAAICALCEKLGLDSRVCREEDELLTIGQAAGYQSAMPRSKSRQSLHAGYRPVTEEFIVLCALEEDTLDSFLEALKEQSLKVSLKAVLTPVNQSWTARRLFAELTAERTAYAAAGSSAARK